MERFEEDVMEGMREVAPMVGEEDCCGYQKSFEKTLTSLNTLLNLPSPGVSNHRDSSAVQDAVYTP